MRVLIRRWARRCAVVLRGTVVAIGAACGAVIGATAPAVAVAADALPLAPGDSLTIDLSAIDRVRIEIPAGDDYVGVRIAERFVTLAVEAQPPGAPAEALRSASAETVPIYWLVRRASDAAITIELRVATRRARAPTAIVGAFAVEPRDLAAWAASTATSRLPELASDDERRRALSAARSAARLWREAGELQRAASLTLAAASLAYSVEDASATIESAEAARAGLEALGDDVAAGYADNLIGLAHILRRDAAAAREALRRAEQRLAPRHDGVAVSPAEGNLCYLALVTGDLDGAEPCYRRLVDVAIAAGDLPQVARFENNLGGVYSERGDAVRAAEYFERALTRLPPGERTRLTSRLLNNLGMQLRRMGQPQQALARYNEALAIARENGDRSQEINILSNLAIVYGDLGAPHRALPILEEIYEARNLLDARRAVLAASNYAGALIDADALDRAADVLKTGIQAAESSVDDAGKLRLRQLAAEVAYESGDYARATEMADSVIADSERLVGFDHFRMLAVLLLGKSRLAAGDHDAAVLTLKDALAAWREAGNPFGEATTGAALALAHWRRGDTDAAYASALASVATIENLRAAVASRDLRGSYQAAAADAYAVAIDCLMARGDPDAALEMVERQRANTLRDALLREARDADADLPDALRLRRARILTAINDAEDARLRGEPAAPIAELLAELDAIDGEIEGPTDRPSTAPPLSVAQMRAQHAPGEQTLVYFIGTEHAYAWRVDADDIEVATLPAGAELDAAARRLHQTLTRRGDVVAEARTLGEALLQPFAERLRQADTVAIVGDRALHYVPFDVLTTASGEQALANKPLAYLPSLTALALTRARQTKAGDGIAVIADPVFARDDTRLRQASTRGGGGQTLNRLRLSRQEADAIRAAAGSRQVTVHAGFEATPAALRNASVARAGVVHIATHGFADDTIPARSGLALSMVDADGNDVTGFVGLRDIYGLSLDADLVVLSACDTALGRNVAGEGLLGLTRGFMYAGARRVVATLWQVEDRATAELMGAFYGALFDGATPAAALARAKASLRASRRYRHPYYWAAFTLHGDWRGAAVR